MPQSITKEQVHSAYALSIRVYSGTLSLPRATDELSEKMSMNRGSAQGYIYTVQRLIEGLEYRRTINAYATDYYLTSIYKDFGKIALNKALNSVKKHLQYYEGVGKSKQPKLHAIVDKHLKALEQQITLGEHIEEFEKQVISSSNDRHEDRAIRLKAASTKPKFIKAETIIYYRNPDVVAEVLYRAAGHCERCKNPAPFKRASDSSPYLEVHHIVPLASGGDDTVVNTLALCPNCHRELHYG